MELLGPLSAWGYRFRGPEFYQGHEWLSFDFPEHPAKLYVACCDRETYQELQEIRLVDTGGIDYWQGGLHYWHSKLLLLTASKALELGFSSRGRSRRGLGSSSTMRRWRSRRPSSCTRTCFSLFFSLS